MSELKPCPCCGSPDVKPRETGIQSVATVYCSRCGIQTAEHIHQKRAIEVWNRRASPWIRFEDRKPEEGQVCVFYWIDSDDLETWKYRKSGMSQNRPSHWMSIPEVEEV